MIKTDNPIAIFKEPIRVLAEPEAVKYGEGEDGYSGFKHKIVILNGDEFPPTVAVHNSEALRVGIYNLVIEMIPEGKIKTRNHYVFNEEETRKLNVQKASKAA